MGLFSLMIIPIIYTQSTKLIEFLNHYITNINQDSLDKLIHKVEVFSPELLNKIDDSLNDFLRYVMSFASGLLKNIFHSGVIAINILSLIFITPIVTFYILRDWDSFTNKFKALIPIKFKGDAIQLIEDLDNTLSGYLRGQIYVCIILGCYYALGLALIGLDSGIALGFITGTLTFIPYVGALFGSTLAILVSALQFQNWYYIGLVGFIFILGQILEGYIITPKLIGSGIASDVLKQFIERIERLEQEKREIAEHVRDLFMEAKGNGFEPKIMKQVIKARKMKKEELAEEEALLDTYKRALGLIED
ncbi:putative permease protein [Reticulomyxa filosa]|uniref:Putative permease protein n=1 Tax=Reticulomyxa filosa TaxID=46433 RepID=X6N4V6_RETFI|nr:putative permease protein [Reticulomyxa filosa]|eukprot:ETO21315.1 putative permease protein [Reticulomyxa filosa]